MDTIFVKQVKEGGPASEAGLCTGTSHQCLVHLFYFSLHIFSCSFFPFLFFFVLLSLSSHVFVVAEIEFYLSWNSVDVAEQTEHRNLIKSRHF